MAPDSAAYTTDDAKTPLEALAGTAFSRVADADQADGNSVKLLRDGPENFPAWLDAIGKAKRTVHLENYILQEDSLGLSFSDALIAAARRGVRCRVLYDWMGCRARTSAAFWDTLRKGGVEVRRYNPPHIGGSLMWVSRDHRKLLCVDGEVGFTGGLCIGHDWAGDPARGIPPWRDTAVEIRGPAMAHLEAAFADSWSTVGEPITDALPKIQNIAAAGDIGLWVIAGKPNNMGLYRLEQLIAEIVQTSLWLTDAYFVATTGYVHALTAAARAGVDVRLLVPGASNWPAVRALSHAGYRPLLEAGVRVFEWNGPMMHAKTAVADGCWSRIGSSNSNLASWISNRELDVTIEDRDFARQMEEMFERDLENATEVILNPGWRRGTTGRPRDGRSARTKRTASAGRLVAGAVGVGSALGATLTQHRALGPAEIFVLGVGGLSLLILSLLAIVFPWLIAYPAGVVGLWIGGTLLSRSWRIWKSGPKPRI
jgi:cardiolipin synthase